MTPTGVLISRRQLLELIPISDSSERRKRKQGSGDWLPHIHIGKRVFYRRAAVDAWLQRQEATCGVSEQPADAALADNARQQPERLDSVPGLSAAERPSWVPWGGARG